MTFSKSDLFTSSPAKAATAAFGMVKAASILLGKKMIADIKANQTPVVCLVSWIILMLICGAKVVTMATGATLWTATIVLYACTGALVYYAVKGFLIK